MIPVLIGLAAGAGIGAISSIVGAQRNTKRAKTQRDMAKEAYGYQRDYNDAMYSLQRTQGLENLGKQKGRLAEAFHMDVSSLNLGLEGQALENRAARVSLADSTGMARAEQGMSGTRGSDTLERRIGFHEDLFDRQVNLQGRGNSLMVQNMTAQYSNQFDDIGREIDSWKSGGYRHEAKTLADIYAANMHGLEMRGHEMAIDDAKLKFTDLLTSTFSGAASGANFGVMLSGAWDQMGKKTGAALAAGAAAAMAPSYSAQAQYAQFYPTTAAPPMAAPAATPFAVPAQPFAAQYQQYFPVTMPPRTQRGVR